MAIRSATDLGGRPPPWVEAAGELGTVVTPLRFLVDGDVGDAAHPPDEGPVWLDDHAGEAATWRLVHERHELVREAGHGAADADAADVGAAADAVHPAALADVALHDRPPAAAPDEGSATSRSPRRIPPARNSRRGRSPRGRCCRTARSAAAGRP